MSFSVKAIPKTVTVDSTLLDSLNTAKSIYVGGFREEGGGGSTEHSYILHYTFRCDQVLRNIVLGFETFFWGGGTEVLFLDTIVFCSTQLARKFYTPIS